MKGTVVSVAVAAMAGVASAANAHRHAHEMFARDKRGTQMETCVPGCTTVWETFYGEPTFYNPHPKPTWTPTYAVVPTPEVEKCPTPGVYTYNATTLTVSETTTVCAATTTKCGKGVHTYGGVTTVVETETTVVCPYATETEKDGVVTSIIETTTYVCPSAGTYTIKPSTTTIEVEETVVVYPTVTCYTPGTYTKPAHVITVTETDYVTVCPYEASATPELPEPEYKPEPEPEPEPETAVEESTPSSGGYTAPEGLGGHGKDHWAITYTPYTEDSGLCKTREQVYEDVEKIKGLGFNTLRIYSTDCDTLKNVGDACEEKGLMLIVGVFVKEAGCSLSGVQKEQVDELVAWGKWNIVSAIVIGNEAVFGGLCSASQLRSLISSCKDIFSGAGYSGPYTTAETVNIWEQYGQDLCDIVDIAGANTHPYFNANTAPSSAGPFVKGQLDIVAGICGKRSISLECGWPSQGNANGVAVPGPYQQREAIDSIRSSCGEDVVFFTYGRTDWKGPGSCNCEPYFAVEDCFA